MLRGELLKVDADCSTKVGFKTIKDLPATFDFLYFSERQNICLLFDVSTFELYCRDRKGLLNKTHYKHRHITGILKIRNAWRLENKSFRSIVEWNIMVELLN